MLAIRIVPNAGVSTLRANGRSYAVNGAAYVDVPYQDGSAIGPEQGLRLIITGATTDRPGALLAGAAVPNWPPREMYDTTLGAPIFYQPNSNPPIWLSIAGVSV